MSLDWPIYGLTRVTEMKADEKSTREEGGGRREEDLGDAVESLEGMRDGGDLRRGSS